MSISIRRCAFFFCALMISLPLSSLAAQRSGYSLTEIDELLKGGVSPEHILAIAQRNCLSFRVNSENDNRLREAGATPVLVTALGTVCRVGLAVNPEKPKKSVKSKEVKPPTAPLLRTLLDYDFRIDKSGLPLVADNCEIKNDGLGYLLSALKPIGVCATLWKPWIPPLIRLQAVFTTVSGEPGYSWGISFGEDSTLTRLYTFQIDDRGQFVMYRSAGTWETSIPPSQSDAVKRGIGSQNQLEVEIRGRFVKLFVNGVRVGSYEANSAVTGYVGVGIFENHGITRIRLNTLRAIEIM